MQSSANETKNDGSVVYGPQSTVYGVKSQQEFASSTSPSRTMSQVSFQNNLPRPEFDFKDSRRNNNNNNNRYSAPIVGALSTYESLVADGDKRREILIQRGNASIDAIVNKMTKEQLQQRLAWKHFDALNNYAMFLPIMAITLFSAILSVLGTSELVTSQEVKTSIGLTVAIFQVILSVLHSLVKQLDFGAKSGAHLSAANTLKKILTNFDNLRTETKYRSYYKALKTNGRLSIGANLSTSLTAVTSHDCSEHSSHSSHGNDNGNSNDNGNGNGNDNGNETNQAAGTLDPVPMTRTTIDPTNDNTSDDDESDNENSDGPSPKEHSEGLAKAFTQTLDQVSSNVPEKIVAAFDMLDSRIDIANKSLLSNKKYSLVAWEKVMPALYFQLTETIIESPTWPLFIPKPSVCVDKCLKNFKDSLSVEKENSADLLMSILGRSHEIGNANKNLANRCAKRNTHRDTMNTVYSGVTYDSRDATVAV